MVVFKKRYKIQNKPFDDPPSTFIDVPVIYDDFSLDRNKAICANSSAVAMYLIGKFSPAFLSASSKGIPWSCAFLLIKKLVLLIFLKIRSLDMWIR